MKNEFITHSAEETQKLGEQFAIEVQQGGVCLYGDLGFGKTTFVQGFAKGLGLERRVISPTFVIVRKYELKIKNQKLKTFYHIDLYRMENLRDLEGLGIQEMLEDKHAIVLIEWPEKLGNILPKDRWDVKFEYINENERRITLKNVKFQNSDVKDISQI